MNLFKDIQAEYGCSYVIVAHDLGTTRFMADRIAVMYLGRLVEVGQTETLFHAPRHPYTKALLSAALPIRQGGTKATMTLKGEVPSPLDPRSGCPSHPRCPQFIGDVCVSKSPKMMRDPHGHIVACHLHPDGIEMESRNSKRELT